MKILITETMYCLEEAKEAVAQIADALGEVILNPYGRKMTPQEVMAHWDDVDVIINGTETYDAAFLAQAPESLKMIARNGVSFENIDLKASEEKKIAVAVVRGANSRAVADGTMALLLAVTRHINVTDRQVRAGLWNGVVADDIHHKTLGILGFGAIGKEVAKRARGFDMTVLAYSPPGEFDGEFAAAHGVQKSDLEEILRCSDFVTLHMPVVPVTRGIINRETLAKMKPSAYLINTSRGALVNEQDLYEALKNGVIRGAALDVFETEPAKDSPLFELDNTVFSPHCAGVSVGVIHEMARINIENILAVSRGDTCGGIVCGPFGTRWE